jgi:acyl-CoA dehydrogenase
MAMTNVDDDIEALLSGMTQFVDDFVIPLENENADLLGDPSRLYENGSYSPATLQLMRRVRTASAEAGYYTMPVPESMGGGGQGYLTQYRAWKHLYGRYGGGRLLPYQTVAHWTNGPSAVMQYFSSGFAAEVAARMMTGEVTMCFGMSEPDAGSDAWAMTTRAAPAEGGGWLLNGTKQWISNSPYANYVLVFAVTDVEQKVKHKGGISAFLLSTDSPGFKVDSVIKLFGHVGGNEGILSFTDVYVPPESLIGDLDRGFQIALSGVSLGRMYNAGRCVGLAEWALGRAVEYSQTRSAFGSKIAEYQGVTFPLADSAIELYCADAIASDCARALDSGERANKQLAIVKAFTTEMAGRVVDRSMQTFGGMGLTNEIKLYDAWHDARIVRIADGSGEVMRRNIVRELMKGNVSV